MTVDINKLWPQSDALMPVGVLHCLAHCLEAMLYLHPGLCHYLLQGLLLPKTASSHLPTCSALRLTCERLEKNPVKCVFDLETRPSPLALSRSSSDHEYLKNSYQSFRFHLSAYQVSVSAITLPPPKSGHYKRPVRQAISYQRGT